MYLLRSAFHYYGSIAVVRQPLMAVFQGMIRYGGGSGSGGLAFLCLASWYLGAVNRGLNAWFEEVRGWSPTALGGPLF